MKTRIILASTSPRRQELLRSTGLQFRSVDSGVDESKITRKTPDGLVRALADAKATAVAEKFPQHIVIGGDTVVVCRGRILGKPHTTAAAKRMLRFISGRAVSVHSGVAIMQAAEKNKVVCSTATQVWIKKLTDREIAAYVKTREPLDKAGAFAIQGKGSVIVNKIHGDYSSVVGLPIPILVEKLPQFGIHLL